VEVNRAIRSQSIRRQRLRLNAANRQAKSARDCIDAFWDEGVKESKRTVSILPIVKSAVWGRMVVDRAGEPGSIVTSLMLWIWKS